MDVRSNLMKVNRCFERGWNATDLILPAFGPVTIAIHIKFTSGRRTTHQIPTLQEPITNRCTLTLSSPTYSVPFSPSSDLTLAWFHLRGLHHLTSQATLAPRSTPGFRLLQAVHQAPNKRWVQPPEVLVKQNGLVLKWCIYSDVYSPRICVKNSAIFCATWMCMERKKPIQGLSCRIFI